jgi:hypothetical protein
MGANLPETEEIDLPDRFRFKENLFGQCPETIEAVPLLPVKVHPPDHVAPGSDHQIAGKGDVSHMIDAGDMIPGDPPFWAFKLAAYGTVAPHSASQED